MGKLLKHWQNVLLIDGTIVEALKTLKCDLYEPYQKLLANSGGNGLCLLDYSWRKRSHFCCSKTWRSTNDGVLITFMAYRDICFYFTDSIP